MADTPASLQPSQATLLLHERLKKQGRDVNINDLDKWVRNKLPSSRPTLPAPTTPAQPRPIFTGTGKLPDWYEPVGSKASESDVDLLNSLGVALWSFADTAAFGVPGALVEEEEFLDFEDPLGKWLGAVGGFAGFVKGAPMRLGAKAVAQVAKPFIKKAGKESADTIIRGMTKVGKEGGLSRKTIKEVTTGYGGLVQKSQMDKTLRGQKFKESSEDFLTGFLDKSPDLTDVERVAVKNMFRENVMKRPLQDFKGLMADSAMSLSSPNTAKVIGHAINDAVMFGLIDTVFEGVSTIEDHEYDWTAPVWGVGTGVAFAQLSWLKPKGKAASWIKDFRSGLKSSFRKNPYKNADREALSNYANFFGKALKGNNASPVQQVSYKGISDSVNLMDDRVYDKFKSIWGDNAEDAMRSFLDSHRKKWGRELMKWSTAAEAENIAQNWVRMGLGGMLFNLHTFHDIYSKGYEPDVSDILPHFLIGAYVQRRSNPAKFDLKSGEVNQARNNLLALGMHPEQLSEIPSLRYTKSPADNIFNDPKWKPVEELARERGIITDSREVSEVRLKTGEVSVQMKPVEGFDLVFEDLLSRGKYAKYKDEVNTKDAEAIMRKMKEIDPSLKTLKDYEVVFEDSRLKGSESFEDSFTEVIEAVRLADVDNTLSITSSVEGKPGQSPIYIGISKELADKARKGELDFLGDLKGEAAEIELNEKIGGLNKILTTANLLGKTKPLPNEGGTNDSRRITSESLLRSTYRAVSEAEASINERFPDARDHVDRFSFQNSYNDYINILSKNYALRSAEKISNIFHPSAAAVERDRLGDILRNVGILTDPIREDGKIGSNIRSDISRIIITDPANPDKALGKNDSRLGEAKRMLNRILTIQSLSGGYDVMENAPRKLVSYDRIVNLEKFLANKGYTKEVWGKDWMHGQITDYIMRDRIKRTNLSIEQADTLFSLAEKGFARFETAVEGRAAGFRVKLIDERVIPDNDTRVIKLAQQYNKYVRQLVEDGGGDRGLVKTEGLVKVLESSAIDSLFQALQNPAQRMSARAQLTQFINSLPTTKKSYTVLGKQMQEFINLPGATEDQLIKWLSAAKVFSLSDPGKGSYEIDMKKFNQKLAIELSNNMDKVGITPEYAESKFLEYEKAVKEKLLTDADEMDVDKGMTLDKFFKKYRTGDNEAFNMNRHDSATKLEHFNDLVYTDVPTKLLAPKVIKNMLKRIHVKRGKDFVKYTNLSSKQKQKEKPVIIRDLISLLARQGSQTEVPMLEWQHGNVVKTKETVNISRFSKFFKETLADEVPYYIINPYASTYELVDGRYVNHGFVDIYRDSANLSKQQREKITGQKQDFKAYLSQMEAIDKVSIRDGDTKGLHTMRLSSNIAPIAIEKRHLPNLVEPYRQFVSEYENMAGVNKKVIEQMQKEIKSFDEGTATEVDYEHALRRMMFKDMLTGKDGNKFFIEFLNGNVNINKTLGRIKLYNTKKFVKPSKDFLLEIADAHKSIGDTETSKAFMRVLRNKGYGVAIWNDESYNTVRDEAISMLSKELPKTSKGKLDIDAATKLYDNIIGEAHKEASAFDSISFVSKDMMRVAHTLVGHSPESQNPIKPIISSGGPDSPLLLGKTVFVYSSALDGFFSKNKGIDILLTKSGAKAYNPVDSGMAGSAADASIINKPWQRITGAARPGQVIGSGKTRLITIDSLGIQANKDSNMLSAKTSMADFNYTKNKEAGNIYDVMFAEPLNQRLEAMKYIAHEPIAMRQWIESEMGKDFNPDVKAGEGMAHINNMFYWSQISRDANPKSYSERMFKNKMYGVYINSLINESRGVTNQGDLAGDIKESHRYSGQAVLIQVPDAAKRLKPTVVDADGKMVIRGEVMLPFHEQNMSIDVLRAGEHGQQMDVRFVRKGETFTGDQIFGKEWDAVARDSTLGTIYADLNSRIKAGDVPAGTQIGVIVSRKPRTRPNDMMILGLKGFLEETYGNGLQVNSLDVVNVFEGDYDVDKADYFFAHRQGMFEHVNRTSKFFVQGVDPTKYATASEFKWTMPANTASESIERLAADNDLYKSSIGVVQKIPRMLGYLDKISTKLTPEEARNLGLKDIIRKNADGEDFVPGVLIDVPGKEGYRIVMDYDNLDFYTRSALETQYIIDGSGKLNRNIAQNINTWKPEFLFPTKGESIVPAAAEQRKAGFINQMRTNGNENGKRVRIFRKINADTTEGELTKLDKAVIQGLLNEYGSMLNATGKTMFEKSGEQRAPNYQDVVDAAEKFRGFNRNISDQLYYRLRNKRIDPNDPNSKKWRDDPEFDSIFGVRELGGGKNEKWKYSKQKKKRYWKPTQQIVRSDTKVRGEQYADGQRGSVIDRITWNLLEADVFNQTKNEGLTGGARGMVEDWYAQMHGGRRADMAHEIDRLNDNIIKGSFSHNKKVAIIESLKKKVMQVLNDPSKTYKQKTYAKDNINKTIKTLEKELGKEIPKSYWKTKSAKDLKKIQIVSMEQDDLKQGAIQYGTMEVLKEYLPFVNGDMNFSLNRKGIERLSELKKLRQLFYSNQTRLEDVMKYKGKSILNSETIAFLTNMPALSTFYKIESDYLRQAYAEHGNPFIFAFMQPANNKYQIAVHNGRVHPVPYQASKRYSRGLQFLTSLATESFDPDLNHRMPGYQDFVRNSLYYLQLSEAQFERYFNNKIELRNVLGTRVGKGVDINELNESQMLSLLERIRLPNFDKDMQDKFTNFTNIQWARDKKRITGGRELTNDHLLDFYSSLMKLAGKEKQFDSYLQNMHDIEAQMLSNNIMSPIEYLSKRSMIESEIKGIAQDVLTSAMTGDPKNPIVQNILSNPVLAIMGGPGYFKGVTFEKQSKLNVERLRNMKNMFETLDSYKEELSFGSHKGKAEFLKLKELCP